MKISPIKRWKAGYVSLMLVLATGSALTLLTVYAFQRATLTMQTQAKVQLRVDYSEKEEAILRSIVAITPNRAIRAMQAGSDTNSASRAPLSWETIFTESLVLANARTSISPALAASLNVTGVNKGNAGDSGLATVKNIFKPIPPHDVGVAAEGININLGPGYPPLLTCTDSTTSNRDQYYPIISRLKTYGTLAQADLDSVALNGKKGTSSKPDIIYGLPVGTYSQFNRLRYPEINFGYAKPGEPFVAKRNWWAFTMDVADHDDDMTYLARPKRTFVLSIYEIPSQLAISASSFMSLGAFSGGDAWQNVTIEGGVFAGRANVEGNTPLAAVASRREITLANNAVIGENDQQLTNTTNPFRAGDRERHMVDHQGIEGGAFFPVSQSSESGRVAFVPINREAAFFDRFAHAPETNVLSTTSWNDYSIGALQCAMRLDITQVTSATNPTPKEFRFSFLRNNTRNTNNDLVVKPDECPPGYAPLWDEGGSFNFGAEVVDVAYGKPGGYAFKNKVSGTVAFNNGTFGDPLPGVFKKGYLKIPFERAELTGIGQRCVAIYPQRMKAFLAALGADPASINNSLVVNVNYSNLGPEFPLKPQIPCTVNDYGLILKECADLTQFTKGFSLVTNLRLYIGDDFNTKLFRDAVPPIPTPAGYKGSASTYYPPCSLFAPEKRYGVDVDPFSVVLGGQIGSLAKSDRVNSADAALPEVRPLDSKNKSGTPMEASNITVNLRPIDHPATLPPITMMNWLVVLEERRADLD